MNFIDIKMHGTTIKIYHVCFHFMVLEGGLCLEETIRVTRFSKINGRKEDSILNI